LSVLHFQLHTSAWTAVYGIM